MTVLTPGDKSKVTDVQAQLLGLASFAYSFWWLEANPNPVNDSYGRHFQHLTILGLSLATLTFVIGLLADITMSTRLFKVKNILSVTSAPMEVLISILYWGLKGVCYDTSVYLLHPIDKSRLTKPSFSQTGHLGFHSARTFPSMLRLR